MQLLLVALMCSEKVYIPYYAFGVSVETDYKAEVVTKDGHKRYVRLRRQ